MDYTVSKLQSEAIDKCFRTRSSEHTAIMKEMIEKAYQAGRKTGQLEMSEEARTRLMSLIPSSLDY